MKPIRKKELALEDLAAMIKEIPQKSDKQYEATAAQFEKIHQHLDALD